LNCEYLSFKCKTCHEYGHFLKECKKNYFQYTTVPDKDENGKLLKKMNTNQGATPPQVAPSPKQHAITSSTQAIYAKTHALVPKVSSSVVKIKSSILVISRPTSSNIFEALT
jgi:hypothetical protein